MRSLFVLPLLLSGLSAQASLVDNGAYTTDTQTSLDWLDLTETVNMTMLDALEANSDWRFATNSEVEILFNKMFVGYYDTNSSGRSLSAEGAYADQYADAQTFLTLFGANFDTAEQQGSVGIYIDEDGIGRGISAWAWRSGAYSGRSEVGGLEYLGNYSSYYDADSYYNHGTLLVRTTAYVPVPAAVWLFGSALAGLGWMRRKQTI
jgi:hypothetical protein